MQQDCESCTGKGVVENGVCRNCGASSSEVPKESETSYVEQEVSSAESTPSQTGESLNEPVNI